VRVEDLLRRPALDHDVARRPQARANGYLSEVVGAGGERYELVSNPCQFDGNVPPLRPAPECGAQTEEVLLELGLGWDEIGALRKHGVL
jgi:crotonobetainyl-CoA:carnitine CoA-transferase CaiB-like acyl-CoA transferase